jgi:hypothetical protein
MQRFIYKHDVFTQAQELLAAMGRTVSDSARDVSLLVLHGEAALDDALGGQLRNRGAHPDHLHLRDGGPDEDGRQDPVAEDQQSGLVRQQPPQEQHGGGGGDGAAAAPGRNWCAPSLHHLCMRAFWVCTMFD